MKKLKEYASDWRKFISNHIVDGNESFTKEQLRESAKSLGLAYSRNVPLVLESYGVMVKSGNIGRFDAYEFTLKPITYKVFEELRDWSNKYKPKEKMKERPRTFSIANHGVSILDEVNEIDKFTDKELVLELRKRGFDVKAEKVVKTIL